MYPFSSNGASAAGALGAQQGQQTEMSRVRQEAASPAKALSPQTGIPATLHLLAEAVLQHEKVVSTLAERLQPVLRPVPSASDDGEGQGPLPHSGVANGIAVLAGRVEANTRRLYELLGALDC